MVFLRSLPPMQSTVGDDWWQRQLLRLVKTSKHYAAIETYVIYVERFDDFNKS